MPSKAYDEIAYSFPIFTIIPGPMKQQEEVLGDWQLHHLRFEKSK